jgi:hypothetical protein
MLRPPRTRQIGVVPFLAGSREVFTTCLDKLRRMFRGNTAILNEWETWGRDRIPQNDFVEDHLLL